MAAGSAPTLQQNPPISWRIQFHVDPLALAWGEDGAPFLLSFALIVYQHQQALSTPFSFFVRYLSLCPSPLPDTAFLPLKLSAKPISTWFCFNLHNCNLNFTFQISYPHFPPEFPHPSPEQAVFAPYFPLSRCGQFSPSL